MVDPKPVSRDNGTAPQRGAPGHGSAHPPGGDDDARAEAGDPGHVIAVSSPMTEDHETGELPGTAAPGPPSKPAKSVSVPSCGVVLGPPREPALGFTLSEIFDQPPPDAGSNALSGATFPGAVPPPPSVEDPGVAQGMERGEKLFPDIMKSTGHAIRNALASVMPLTFESLSNFGMDELARVADLVGQVSTMTDDLHKIDAAEQIRGIVADAERANAKPSLLDRVGIHSQFDLEAANAQIDAIRRRLSAELYKIRKASVDIERVMIPLNAAISVTRILADGAGQSELARVIERRASLFASSSAEVDIAKKQLENLRKLAEEGILQCDELKTVTLPAMGFRQSL